MDIISVHLSIGGRGWVHPDWILLNQVLSEVRGRPDLAGGGGRD